MSEPVWKQVPIPSKESGNRPPWPTHSQSGKPDHLFPYPQASGELAYCTARWDAGPNRAEKEIRPLTLWEQQGGKPQWRWQRPETWLLMSLDKIATRPNGPILVVEGEGKAIKAQEMFPDFIVTTSGPSTSANRVSWLPLRGRNVFVWPDHDEPGQSYARDVSKALQGIAASVKIVSVPTEFPEKWDLKDDPPGGWDLVRLRGLLDAAVEILPVPPPEGEPKPGQRDSSPFLSVDMSRVWLDEPPPLRWIVEGLLPLGMPGVLVAPGGLGKSGLALSIGAALATGHPILGRQCSDGVPPGALYVSMEDDREEIHRRLHDLRVMREAEGTWSQKVETAIRRNFKPLIPNWTLGNMALAHHWQWIVQEAKAMDEGCGLVVLDTFSALNPGQDENSTGGTSKVLDAMIAISQETGSTVLALHHTPKGYGATTEKKLSQRMHSEASRGAGAITFRARFALTALPITPGEAGSIGLDEMRALREEYACFGLTKFNQGIRGPWMLLERQGRFLAEVPHGENLLERLVTSKPRQEQTKVEQVLVEVLLAGNLLAMNRLEVAGKLWPGATTSTNQLSKAIGEARKRGLLDDHGLSLAGRKLAEDLLPDDVPVPPSYRGTEHGTWVSPAGPSAEQTTEQWRNKGGTATEQDGTTPIPLVLQHELVSPSEVRI